MSTEQFTVSHLSIKDIKRIFSKIIVNKTTGCWEWHKPGKYDGYAKLLWKGTTALVHRIMYAWLVAPLPRGVQGRVVELDHLCRVRHCCNPAHLELVTRRENVLRGEGVCAKHAKQTHCKRGHELTPENTYDVKGNRGCLRCKKTMDAAYYQAHKATKVS